MSNQPLNQINEQMEKFFTAPGRAYAELAVDHFDKLVSLQFEAGKAYTEATINQLRAALDIKDVQGLTKYMEDQQKTVRELSERMKDDTQKVVSLSQAFVQDAQKLGQETVRKAPVAKAK
ncbi:MAG: phasin family protein [Ectothiorhodospiraceae bacterium]|nr:phasin family protein [Ectothiorhodospiraceae bacterium]